MAATKQQVKVIMDERESGKSQVVAAAKASVSERTGRRIEHGDVVQAHMPRHWRTRPAPFEAAWDEVVEQLTLEPSLQALTLLEWLQERYPGNYPYEN